MKISGDKDSKIPDFSSDEEAFEWYESHEMTGHLECTEEVKPGSIFYEDVRGHWFRSSDGVLVSAPKERAKVGAYIMEGRGYIINEASLRVEGDKVTCTPTTLSSATTLNLETK